jgi:hypothetical protein
MVLGGGAGRGLGSYDAVLETVVQFGAAIDRKGRACGGVDGGDEVDGTGLRALHFSDFSKSGGNG